jgi:hypothetical protein
MSVYDNFASILANWMMRFNWKCLFIAFFCSFRKSNNRIQLIILIYITSIVILTKRMIRFNFKTFISNNFASLITNYMIEFIYKCSFAVFFLYTRIMNNQVQIEILISSSFMLFIRNQMIKFNWKFLNLSLFIYIHKK